MNVVLLITSRGQRPAGIAGIIEQLGIRADDANDVCLVSWHRPVRPLPVQRHLLLGPGLSPFRSGRSLPVAPLDLDTPLDLEPTETDVVNLTVAQTELEVSDADAPLEPVEAPELPAIYHPVRIVKAIRWRSRRLKRAVRMHPTVDRLRRSTKVGRLLTGLFPGRVATEYAIACVTSREVGREVERADLVVALDGNSHRAAWLLARRHPRPAVVVGAAAGARKLKELT